MQRVIEEESMDSLDEAIAYDNMVSLKWGNMLDECFAISALKLGVNRGKLLDIGTGTARIPIKIISRAPNFIIKAVDLSANMLNIAKKNIEKANMSDKIEVDKRDAKNLEYPDNTFDIVISNSTLHHVSEPISFLNEIERVLKPEGALLIRDVKRPKNEKDLETYLSIFARYFNPYQKQLFKDSLLSAFSIEELNALIKKTNLKNVNTTEYFAAHLGIEKKSEAYENPECDISLPQEIDFMTKKMISYYITD